MEGRVPRKPPGAGSRVGGLPPATSLRVFTSLLSAEPSSSAGTQVNRLSLLSVAGTNSKPAPGASQVAGFHTPLTPCAVPWAWSGVPVARRAGATVPGPGVTVWPGRQRQGPLPAVGSSLHPSKAPCSSAGLEGLALQSDRGVGRSPLRCSGVRTGSERPRALLGRGCVRCSSCS